MKHMRLRFVMLLSLVILATVGVFAAEVGGILDEVTGLDIGTMFISFAAMVPVVTALSGILINWANAKGFGKQAIAWGVGLALAFGGWALKFGYLLDLPAWHVLIYGFGAGLAANGFSDIPIVKEILYGKAK